MNPGIRLLAIDIDGTLLDSRHQLPPANLQALQQAHESGIEVILVTGRRHRYAMSVAAMLGFDLWVISSNGAVTRSTQGELFHRDLFPASSARALIAHMDAFRGQLVLTFDVDARGAIVIEELEAMTRSIRVWLERNMEYIQFVRPIEDALTADPVQAMFCGPIPLMQQAESLLQDPAIRAQATILKTQYDHRDLCILDVLNRSCSKGHAVKRWAAFKGLGAEQVMAIGDNYNDVEMLEFAGHAVIMENACPELKQNGWQVTLSNDRCGVAAVIERILHEGL
ncbi:MAG TPA: Cof-type HAD-IIB family hydrolase [Terriglobales bacterium]|nr:Cof-type HAD-IIB family hydrolase [Terriglobales bacterium]